MSRLEPSSAFYKSLGLTMILSFTLEGCAAVIGIEETSLQEVAECGDEVVEGSEACDGGSFCSDSCQWLPGYDFSCLSENSPDSEGTIEISHQVLDLNDQEPLSLTQVAACGPVDANCRDTFRIGETDDTGAVVLSLVSPFQGSFEFRKEGFINLQKFRNAPISSDTSIVTSMLSQPLFAAIAEAISGAAPEADVGHITVEIQDCQGEPAPDFIVSLSDEEGASASYFDGGAPSAKTKTTSDGRYAAINVTPGAIQIVVEREDGVKLEGSVVVRAPEAESESVPFVSNLLLSAAP